MRPNKLRKTQIKKEPNFNNIEINEEYDHICNQYEIIT
jgi:hypothetical protein